MSTDGTIHTSAPQDPEVQAMETICATLAPLDTGTAQRVISEVAERFGITLTPLGEK